MKTTILEMAAFLIIISLVGIAVVKAIPKELHRQDVACCTMQKNGYEVECK